MVKPKLFAPFLFHPDKYGQTTEGKDNLKEQNNSYYNMATMFLGRS